MSESGEQTFRYRAGTRSRLVEEMVLAGKSNAAIIDSKVGFDDERTIVVIAALIRRFHKLPRAERSTPEGRQRVRKSPTYVKNAYSRPAPSPKPAANAREIPVAEIRRIHDEIRRLHGKCHMGITAIAARLKVPYKDIATALETETV